VTHPSPEPARRELGEGPGSDDPHRWVTLAVVIMSAFIIVLDNSVLNVAIPTILREFHTTLPSLQWVVTGYSLTFATLLIIGGRLGDVYGHRRIFIIGTGLFGAGSLLASVSQSVPQLVLGEAIIEGIGASLMMPATLAILSSTFRGRERATAFAMWGATAGAAAAFGPVIGGILTTNYSWRWAFRINVIVAPIAIAGALLFMRHGERQERRLGIDVPGALLVSSGMFLLVFGLSEGGTYGWLTPLKTFSVASAVVWPDWFPVSVIPIVFLLAFALLATFYVYERAKERRGGNPLFAFSLLRRKTLRYGLTTAMVLSMGQLGVLFVLPVFLQDGKGLTAEQNGFWMLPTGLFVVLGAQVGARFTHRVGTTVVVRIGLAMEAIGIFILAVVVGPALAFWQLLVPFAFYGIGIGFAAAQLTNVVLSEIPREKSGVVSGANTTVRQVGSALGIAVIGSLLTTQTIRHATATVQAASIASDVKTKILAGIHDLGANFSPPLGSAAHVVTVVHHALDAAVASGTRFALVFAAVVVTLGAALSLLIPRSIPLSPELSETVVEELQPLEPVTVDPALLEGVEATNGADGGVPEADAHAISRDAP
jgi:EmrB/QacA subfamily drug resistance transporter